MVHEPEFFIDRSLGRIAVPEFRACGLVVHPMAEVYGEKIGQGLADETWLRDVGERGWIVLMKDDAIRRRPAEREALIAGGVRAFCLTNAQLRGEEQARRFDREPPPNPPPGRSARTAYLQCLRGAHQAIVAAMNTSEPRDSWLSQHR
jgi:hypothetical protein